MTIAQKIEEYLDFGPPAYRRVKIWIVDFGLN